MKRLLSSFVLACAALAVLLAPEVALACPSCKAAAEADPKLPNAFLASSLFMLAMPVTLATCFGVAFYRLSQAEKKQQIREALHLRDPGDTAGTSQSD